MELQPVARYREPRYPTQSVLDRHPELLKLVPKRWRRNRVVLSALGLTAALVLGARGMARAQDADREEPAFADAPVSLVAPIFVHGVGRGATGCIVTNPPVFLSEEEARQVVAEEALKGGVGFGDIQAEVDVSLPLVDYGLVSRWLGPVYARLHPEAADAAASEWTGLVRTVEGTLLARLTGEGRQQRTDPEVAALTDGVLAAGRAYWADEQPETMDTLVRSFLNDPDGVLETFPGGDWLASDGQLDLDGSDVERGIHYEYVSEHDFAGVFDRPGVWLSVRDHDPRHIAEVVRAGLVAAAPSGTYAVFYDPVAYPADVPWPKGTGEPVSGPFAAGGSIIGPLSSTSRPSDDDIAKWRSDIAESRRAAEDEAKDLLRAQVRDFIEWLKAEGVV